MGAQQKSLHRRIKVKDSYYCKVKVKFTAVQKKNAEKSSRMITGTRSETLQNWGKCHVKKFLLRRSAPIHGY